MSMVSPGYYIQEATKGKSYAELIEMRSEFIKAFEDFERKYVFNTETVEKPMIHPSPEVIYQVNMDYLIELLKVMQEKFREEYIYKTELDELFAEIEPEAKRRGMTVEEFVEWFKNNNPEIDWGEPKGGETW